jgi:hypothetical protein
MTWNSAGLRPSTTPGAQVQQIGEAGWRLSIPAGPAGKYRLAELDDYSGMKRGSFTRAAPFRLRMQVRASSMVIPGTWGLGLWNDPFGMGIGSRVQDVRLPALPNAAWFFFASAPNHLSLRDDQPGSGALAAVFRSGRGLTALVAMGSPVLMLLAIPATARVLRRFARNIVKQEATALLLDPTEWHEYYLEWQEDAVHFQVDNRTVFLSRLAPMGRLGLVVWIDNQYASFTPEGRLSYGTLPAQEESWIEVINFTALDNHLTCV